MLEGTRTAYGASLLWGRFLLKSFVLTCLFLEEISGVRAALGGPKHHTMHVSSPSNIYLTLGPPHAWKAPAFDQIIQKEQKRRPPTENKYRKK